VHQEFPEKWPSCFTSIVSLVKSKVFEQVITVLNILLCVFEECDDRLSRSLPELLPVLLEMYQTFWDSRIRDKIIEVLGLTLESLSWADGIEQDLVDRSLIPTWPVFFKHLTELLSSTTMISSKQKVFKVMTVFYRDFNFSSQPWIIPAIPYVWTELYSLVPKYAELAVFNKENALNESLEDSAGGYEGLAGQLLELVSCVVVRPVKNDSLVKELGNFINVLMWFMLLTAEQQDLWKNEPNQFIVEDDAEEGWKSSRIAAVKLVSDVIEIWGDQGIAQILSVLESALQSISVSGINLLSSNYIEMKEVVSLTNGVLEKVVKHYYSEFTWKMREVVVLIIGTLSKDILMFNTKARKQGTGLIEVTGVLYNVVLRDIRNSQEILTGRALWCIGKVTDLLDPSQCLEIFIETCRCIQSRSVAVKLSACYAFYKLSQKINPADVTEVLTELLVGLLTLLEEVTSETLHIVLDTILQISRLSAEATSRLPPAAAGVILRIFSRYFGESLISSKIMALLRCWSDLASCIQALIDSFVPFVLVLLSGYPATEKVTSFSSNSTIETRAASESVMILPSALEILSLFVKKSKSESCERVKLLDLLPYLLELLSKNDEPSILLHGTALLRAYACYADQEIIARGMVDRIIESTLTLLDPYKNEAGALHLGFFVVNIFSKLSPQIDQDLLVGCMNKLYRCKMPSVVQGFVLVFARLIHSYSSEIIGFLSTLTVERRAGLKVLLDKWLIHQPLIRGRYSKNCTITALSRLFILKDPQVETLLVVGYNPSHSNVGSEVIAPLKILCTLIRCLDNESFIPKRKAQEIGLNEEFNTVIEGSGMGLRGEFDDPGDRMDTIEDDDYSPPHVDPIENLKSDLMKEIKEDFDANDFKIPVSKDKGLGDYETGSECLMSDMLEFDYEDADDVGEDFHEDDLYSLGDWYGSISLQSFLLDFFNNLINNDKEYLFKCIKHLLPDDIALFRKHFTFN
jgi:hypothetical protein